MADVQVTCADNRPLSELAKLIQERGKWLNETAEQSCAACMIDILVSLRALTMVAKPTKNEIVLTDTPLTPSFTGGRDAPKFCLRNGKTRYTPASKERIGITSGVTSKVFKTCKVFRWQDIKERVWLIVALSKKDASQWAYDKVKKRAKRFKGLAKAALSKLMMMSGSKTSQPLGDSNVSQAATKNTKVTKMTNGTGYHLEAKDLLEYAKLALQGGESAINEALMKASNKISSVINQKAKNLLSFEKLDTPFPEVKQK